MTMGTYDIIACYNQCVDLLICGQTQLNCMIKVKVRTLVSAGYISQSCDQQRFTISEVAADWHEPTVPQRIMLAIH